MTNVFRSENGAATGTRAGVPGGVAGLPDPPFFGSFRRLRANAVPFSVGRLCKDERPAIVLDPQAGKTSAASAIQAPRFDVDFV
jgi:hypothetical protein